MDHSSRYIIPLPTVPYSYCVYVLSYNCHQVYPTQTVYVFQQDGVQLQLTVSACTGWFTTVVYIHQLVWQTILTPHFHDQTLPSNNTAPPASKRAEQNKHCPCLVCSYYSSGTRATLWGKQPQLFAVRMKNKEQIVSWELSSEGEWLWSHWKRKARTRIGSTVYVLLCSKATTSR